MSQAQSQNPFVLILQHLLSPEDINEYGHIVTGRSSCFHSIAGAVYKLEATGALKGIDITLMHAMITTARPKGCEEGIEDRIEIQRLRVETVRMLAIAWKH
ncbi:hypothetical protein [Delftia phage PhiW-14]|uniref:Uncharacterized protein n=1 Tax=Delftia phage PhiW-14 TaxID=665032 RepID=C9DGA7_BPW14|nr:hypothetical protein DP-phiW-14_gp137 [Delftia phage PhiW-14]ACV50158.1 hypothetical protein [Delftia phage PhiW-14]